MAINRTILLFAISIGTCTYCLGQQDSSVFKYNKMLSRFCVEPSINYGQLYQQIDGKDLKVGYKNANPATNIYSNVKFNDRCSYFGTDLKIFKYNKNNTIGLGTGISLFRYRTTADLDNFSVQYQSTDYYNNTFKQIITSVSPVRELIDETHFTIPLIIRFKKEKYRNLGFFLEMGILLGDYTYWISNAKARFDYEAIYYQQNGSWVYDDHPGSSSSQVILTKDFIRSQSPALQDTAAISNFFRQLRDSKNKYNIGLNEMIESKKRYSSLSYFPGYTAALGLNYTLNAKLSMKFGVGVDSRTVNRGGDDNYMITDRVGSYNSMLSGVKERRITTLSMSLGISWRIGNNDIDGDKIRDNKDQCITEAGLFQYCGCGDSDNDGIPDRDDRCPYLPGLVFSGGCPDADGDGVPDFADSAKYIPGDESLAGRPRPLDIIDTNNLTANEINVDLFVYIDFSANDTLLSASEKFKLNKLIKNQSSESKILIYQCLDENRLGRHNDMISHLRAEAIINYLVSGGIDKFRIDDRTYSEVSRYKTLKIIAYGENIYDKAYLGMERSGDGEQDVRSFKENMDNDTGFTPTNKYVADGGHKVLEDLNHKKKSSGKPEEKLSKSRGQRNTWHTTSSESSKIKNKYFDDVLRRCGYISNRNQNNLKKSIEKHADSALNIRSNIEYSGQSR